MEHPLSQFKYCPKCGSEHFEIHNEKSKFCKDCGFVYYFNSSSATVALILNERNELLVCRRAKEPAKGHWTLPGGFIEHGGNRRGRSSSVSGKKRRYDSDTSRVSVFTAEHLYLFRISRTYAGYVFPLYGSRYSAFRSNGRCGGSFLSSFARRASE